MKFKPLKENKVHIYCLHLPIYPELKFLKKYLPLLDSSELKRFNELHYKKQEFLISRILLKKIIGNYLNIDPSNVQFQANLYGKLYLNEKIKVKIDDKIKFSLSHTKHLIICAFALNFEIGVDAELIRADFNNSLIIAEQFFLKKEFEYLFSTSKKNQNKMFFKIWTLKEAYMKAMGKGFSIRLNSFEVPLSTSCTRFKNLDFFHLDYKNNYSISVVIKNKENVKLNYQIIEFNWKDFLI